MRSKQIRGLRKTEVEVSVGNKECGIEAIYAVAKGAKVIISADPEFRGKMEASRKMLAKALKSGTPVYGVTTGFGKSCAKRLAVNDAVENGEHLLPLDTDINKIADAIANTDLFCLEGK